MHGQVFEYVPKCGLCQRAKQAQDTRVGLYSASPVPLPMDRLFIDFVGPLVRNKRGNIAILVVVDSFSKFVSFRPVRKMTSLAVSDYLALSVTKDLGVTYAGKYSIFRLMVHLNPLSRTTPRSCAAKSSNTCASDWGSNTPYYTQGFLAERVNRNVKSALKLFHHESQNSWDEDLPWMRLAINTAVNQSTRSTPDVLFLVRELKCPLGVQWDPSPVSNSNNNSTNQF